jgi:hypothetical protein
MQVKQVYGSTDPTLLLNEALLAGNSFTGAIARTAGENVVTSPYALTSAHYAGTNYTVTIRNKYIYHHSETITVSADASQSKVYGSTD